ncbi:hypothetical protein HYFRA_00000113 [Hymenoscyphus fraxineus]|uniref:Reverse transcriptase domain-containing protein n=1 Tax=Hymenoscyphus fraxineus TaxID=746836 RepID=A0A9N9L0B4_9HELO|nr:hypothetical protein HYFRA_00000113 [Hymenoscyphus fraxineus]
MATQTQPVAADSTANLLSQTLTSVTNIKLSELTKQRSEFETKKDELSRAVQSESDQLRKLQLLVDSRICENGLKVEVRRFLELAKVDPSVSTEVMKSWQGALEDELRIRSEKLKYAGLYGELVKEWLEGGLINTSAPRKFDTMKDAEQKEIRKQRQTWEAYAFQPRDTDTAAIRKFLEELFSTGPIIQTAYKEVVKSTHDFETFLKTEELDECSMTWIIEGMLKTDSNSFAPEKREILTTFLRNDAAMVELADVLNMRLASLETHEWHSEPIQVEQRRQLSGKYRFFQDEDLLQSILIYYIGVEWSIHFKNTLRTFRSTPWVWKPSSKPMEKVDLERRCDFLGVPSPDGRTNERSVESARETHFLDDIFLEQLQASKDPQTESYNMESDTRLDQNQSQNTVQHLLHILAAETILKQKQGGDMSVIRSDFRWFGPSLPHSTIFAVLSFFGVSEHWIGIFRRILEAPIKFVEDGPDGKVQVRKRGVPIQGQLGTMFGETCLFCLDFAFNQLTDGTRLYRLHDDIWFWGDKKSCVEGWKIVSKFTELMGLEINEEKTGGVMIGGQSDGLPEGDVKWGFLKLDSSTGRFLIDQEGVDQHIVHLSGQLSACESVFDWIQVWNVYGARFFFNNFGIPANCFGQAHVDAMVETFAYIQRKAFSSTGGSVTSTLKSMLRQKFNVEDIPDGYLYFPVADGGLELRNPIADLLAIRRHITKDPSETVQKALDEEQVAYSKARSKYENETSLRTRRAFDSAPTVEFMSFEEFTKYREQTSDALGDAYRDLTVVHSVKSVGSLFGEFYHVREMYRDEMTKRFGSLEIVPKEMLATGMVDMFRNSRLQWKE